MRPFRIKYREWKSKLTHEPSALTTEQQSAKWQQRWSRYLSATNGCSFMFFHYSELSNQPEAFCKFRINECLSWTISLPESLLSTTASVEEAFLLTESPSWTSSYYIWLRERPSHWKRENNSWEFDGGQVKQPAGRKNCPLIWIIWCFEFYCSATHLSQTWLPKDLGDPKYYEIKDSFCACCK